MVSARVSNVQVFPPLTIFAGSGWIYGRSMRESIWRKKETQWSKTKRLMQILTELIIR